MGSFRSQPQTCKHTIEKSFDNFKYAVSHMCGWRLYMEDAHLSITPFTKKNFSLFAVFDGHGGAQVAAFAQRHFAKQLEDNDNFKTEKYEKALKQTFLKIDELIISESGQEQIRAIQKQMREKGNGPNHQQPSHAGCTANVVLMTPEHIYCANAGDSRSVASIKKETVPLSEDHKPEDEKQINRIQKAGGIVSYGRVNGNLNLSRALGDLQYKYKKELPPEEQMITADPDIKKIKNENIEFIIMGCDGIWQVKSNSEMISWMRKRLQNKDGLGSILQELLTELLAKNKNSEYGMDNMSSILISF